MVGGRAGQRFGVGPLLELGVYTNPSAGDEVAVRVRGPTPVPLAGRYAGRVCASAIVAIGECVCSFPGRALGRAYYRRRRRRRCRAVLRCARERGRGAVRTLTDVGVGETP